MAGCNSRCMKEQLFGQKWDIIGLDLGALSTHPPRRPDWWNVHQQVYNNSRILPHYIQWIQHLK